MTICRFEDAINKQALALYGLRRRIEARSPAELPLAMDAIAASQREGHWIALMLPYSLGEWLEPGLRTERAAEDGESRLSALVFERCEIEPIWGAPAPDQQCEIISVRPQVDFAEYSERLAQIRHWIEAGEVYQINYTFPLDVQIDGSTEALYRTLINRHPAGHAAYISDQGRHVLSFSPELFLSRRGERLTSRPMKGTAPRHVDPLKDLQAAQALQASVKDRAENAMIADLLRNDLGKLARAGSVSVEKLFNLERYPSIWTMTSTISADIGRASLFDVLRALFPCGSVTGAPKLAAMRQIRELENVPRGLYCGSIGWCAPNGDFSLNVAIRTLVVDADNHGVYGVGGGIVYDSDPMSEWLECQWKSRIMSTRSSTMWGEREPAFTDG